MSRWTNRFSAWPRVLGLTRAAAAPRVERPRSFYVLEADGEVFRAAHIREQQGGLALLGLENFRTHAELADVLERLERFEEGPPRTAVLVTDEIALDCSARELELPRTVLERWSAPLTGLGVRLGLVLPLSGSPLLNLERAPREPALLLQVERRSITTMEIVAGRCAELHVLRDIEPTPERCRELVGTGCPEVLLAGKGVELSALGYSLARTGTTWVRILRPKADLGVFQAGAHGLAAILGAARLAAGQVSLPTLVPVRSTIALRARSD